MDSVKEIIRISDEMKLTLSNLDFLRLLEQYIDNVKGSNFLSQALLLLKDYHHQETTELTRLANSTDTELYSIQDDVQEQIDQKYPLYSFRQMIEAQKNFQYIKQYKKESDIPDEHIVIQNNDPYITFTTETKKSLKRIPKLVDLLGTKIHFKQFHEAFIVFIDQLISKGGIFSKYFDYDSNKGILFFKEKEIEINERKKLTNAHHLLTYLFSNEPFEQHFYSELEHDKVLLDPKSWKSYYDACNDIQNKVKEKTGIADFLNFSSGPKMYVGINPEYSMKNI